MDDLWHPQFFSLAEKNRQIRQICQLNQNFKKPQLFRVSVVVRIVVWCMITTRLFDNSHLCVCMYMLSSVIGALLISPSSAWGGRTPKSLLILSQFVRPRVIPGLQKLLGIYLNMWRTNQQSGLAVRKELLAENRNLINIKLQHTEELSDSHYSGLNTSESGSLNNKKTIAYSKHALRTIGQLVQHN